MPGLELTNLTVARNGFPIVRAINLVVAPGELVVLLGPNGAGKTTMLEAISGVLPCASGGISLAGTAIERLTRVQRAQRGLAHVEQGRTVFAHLTVAENLQVGARQRAIGASFELFPELVARQHTLAGLLSGGEQQMLVLARALLCQPTVLLVDELSLGLAPLVIRRLMPLMRQLADRGVAVLLVEQYAALALDIGDRAYVLNHGALVFQGSCADLRNQPGQLQRAYLGARPI